MKEEIMHIYKRDFIGLMIYIAFTTISIVFLIPYKIFSLGFWIGILIIAFVSFFCLILLPKLLKNKEKNKKEGK